ncbi:hypothetical protein CA600_21130 [Paenibacillus sp. VTT E-133280]|uniref:hypothetical protein n=1 Tax=Paenibacillus sp. VTT E-133280 TaxID=1986222 RepID=UPI000B9FE336|nr:hypothetical protein [Paenibacillus sp. VTT E-133280]OZQ62769.1 hypothetical protein CA600_21130 [Paenibacillus sp. VTT E-133280]
MNKSIDELLDINKLITEMVEIINNHNLTRYSKAYYLKNVAIQTWTEHYPLKNSKQIKCKFWSADAFKQKFDVNFIGEKERLFHEHVIPKSYLIEEIFLNEEGQPVTFDYIQHYLDEFVFACVVTKSEHDALNEISKSSMPDEFRIVKGGNYLNMWLRYSKADIEVYEIEWVKRQPTIKCVVDYTSSWSSS